MSKNEFINTIIEQVRNIPVSEIVGNRIDLERAGKYHDGLCPFHNDDKTGSFKVTDSRGRYHCFACGEGGDGIKFAMEFDSTEFLQTTFNLAHEFKIIGDKEYAELSEGGTVKEADEQKIVRQYEKRVKKEKAELPEPVVLDCIYRILAKLSGLSETHKKELTENRGLSEEQIERGCYFTFPSASIMGPLLLVLENEYGSTEMLKGVPGFYYSKTKNWSIVKRKGMAIGIQNSDGHIVGIQIRSDVKTKAGRYFWLSSDDPKYKFGASPGVPVDVIIPEKIKYQTILITEGRFKSEILARDKGSITLSVQGVGSWEGIASELEGLALNPRVKEQFPEGFHISCVMVAFDADLASNVQVQQQMKNMTDVLVRKRYPVYYLNWDVKLGKGVDDLILAGHTEAIQRYAKEPWDEEYEKMIHALEQEEERKIKDIPKAVVGFAFRDFMQRVTPLAMGEYSEMHKLMTEKKKID